jgi:acetyl-CoA acetyltransferase
MEFSQFTGRRDAGQEVRPDEGRARRFALESHQRAIAATQAGRFAAEIVPVAKSPRPTAATGELHTVDEGIRFDATLEGIAGVKLLQEGGVHHGRQRQPDLRRRHRRDGRQRARPEGAGRESRWRACTTCRCSATTR